MVLVQNKAGTLIEEPFVFFCTDPRQIQSVVDLGGFIRFSCEVDLMDDAVVDAKEGETRSS